ncbi:DUF6318 family protein [Schaalia georgiae]|uniref:DUF6318 family protein n=1 Tax=Schaalia georgiae TaxID=52768 RepID=UPI001FB14175|nr:DUF6318 family protein [Schaalia georgiae]
MNTDDEHAMDSTRPSTGLASDRAAPGRTVDDPATNRPADASSLRAHSTDGPASSGLPVGDPDSDETSPVGDQSDDGTAETGGTGLAGRKGQRSTPAGPGGSPSTGDQSADGASVGDGFADNLPAGDPVDDLPDGGGGMSPVVREYVEGLRREALARDAALRARGIDPYKGTPVDEGPRRRWGVRALVVLVVLVAVVSVGAYVVFFRGEPDYGMSHGYQVQSDGSLKRPPVTDKAPAQPAQMSKGDEAGAKATARYYLKARAYAWNTGDTGPLKSISEESCMYCQNAITKVEEFYAHGYWATKGYTDVLETQAIEQLPEDEYGSNAYGVQLRFDEHLAEGYTSSGFQEGEVYTTIIKLHVRWDGSAWRVMEGAAKDAQDVK